MGLSYSMKERKNKIRWVGMKRSGCISLFGADGGIGLALASLECAPVSLGITGESS